MNKYNVTGVAFVAVEIKMTVDADSEEAAEKEALVMFEQDAKAFVVSGSEDSSHPFDFEPHAEKI